MKNSQQLLLSVLQNPSCEFEAADLAAFNEYDLGDLFIDVSFLQSAAEYLREGCWLEQQKPAYVSSEAVAFIQQAFYSELSSLSYLQDLFLKTELRRYKDIEKHAHVIETEIIHVVRAQSKDLQNHFIHHVLSTMVQRFNTESLLQIAQAKIGKTVAITLYRTFDRLDEVLGLDYEVEKTVKSELSMKERLYEGAGVGVQSSYSTLLTALREIAPKHGARFIDLGSGYGRVGLVLGFLRPDMDFIGYEYVPQRVEVAKDSSVRLGLSEHVHFHVQDLSDRNFSIPEADVYYLYDPFSEDTYKYVLNQLVLIAQTRPIVIATKGNAKGWLKNVALENGWPAPQEFAEDNLCLFRSQSIL